jgi:hypothetical protein
MARTVLREQVPVDDCWHTITLRGPIIHVATRHNHMVELWVFHDTSQPVTTRDLPAVGTGHPLTDEMCDYVGTAIVPSGALVWHLFERRTGGGN